MSDIEAILRKAAVEIRAADLPGWGNACEWGADRIRELEADLAHSPLSSAPSPRYNRAMARIAELEAALRKIIAALDDDSITYVSVASAVMEVDASGILTPSETSCEPRKPMLSDMSDAVIRELHRQGMVSMRSEFDGAVLRIEPATFTETFGCTPVAGDPVCPDCGNRIDPDCCGCGESKEGHNAWNAGHEFVPMGCDCHRATSDRGTKHD